MIFFFGGVGGWGGLSPGVSVTVIAHTEAFILRRFQNLIQPLPCGVSYSFADGAVNGHCYFKREVEYFR